MCGPSFPCMQKRKAECTLALQHMRRIMSHEKYSQELVYTNEALLLAESVMNTDAHTLSKVAGALSAYEQRINHHNFKNTFTSLGS